MKRAPAVVDSISGVLMALGFLVFIVDTFTEGGIRRIVRERLTRETPQPEPHRTNEVFGVAAAAEEITKGATR